jgi:hypothetical protein
VKKIGHQLENGSLWREKITKRVLEVAQFVFFFGCKLYENSLVHITPWKVKPEGISSAGFTRTQPIVIKDFSFLSFLSELSLALNKEGL